MRVHKQYTLHMSLNFRSSALFTSRTVMDLIDKEECLRESAKGTGVPQKQWNIDKKRFACEKSATGSGALPGTKKNERLLEVTI